MTLFKQFVTRNNIKICLRKNVNQAYGAAGESWDGVVAQSFRARDSEARGGARPSSYLATL